MRHVVQRALKPFYFLVHPDFFNQKPSMRSTNEDSLKLLNQHLEWLLCKNSAYRRSASGAVPFYLRSNEGVKKICIHLNANNADQLVQSILRQCNLPAIGQTAGVNQQPNATNEQRQSLAQWLSKLKPEAERLRRKACHVRRRVATLSRSIAQEYNVKDIQIDEADVNLLHGSLTTLGKVLRTYPEMASTLENVTVRFACESCLSPDGAVVLGLTDGWWRWLTVLQSAHLCEQVKARVERGRQRVGDCLGGLCVKLPKNCCAPTWLGCCDDLLARFRRENVRVRLDHGPRPPSLMLLAARGSLEPYTSPEGVLIVPFNAAPSCIAQYVALNGGRALRNQLAFRNALDELERLRALVTRRHSLLSLTNDQACSVNEIDKLAQSLHRLLNVDQATADVLQFQALHLHAGFNFSLTSSGHVRLPYNWF